ncbi:hypothetical protein [Kribbella capetownensis]|uniref:hypothetical protein n=1 Tax=Kribbella capetownensis TaxID=1572659 RepID=UPI0013F3ECB3|nr:hypothetical protein [Kribbella capetownensis]
MHQVLVVLVGHRGVQDLVEQAGTLVQVAVRQQAVTQAEPSLPRDLQRPQQLDP